MTSQKIINYQHLRKLTVRSSVCKKASGSGSGLVGLILIQELAQLSRWNCVDHHASRGEATLASSDEDIPFWS